MTSRGPISFSIWTLFHGVKISGESKWTMLQIVINKYCRQPQWGYRHPFYTIILLYNCNQDMFRALLCLKHAEEYNKSYYKTTICALSWLIAKIILGCMVSKISKINKQCSNIHSTINAICHSNTEFQ